SNGAATPKLRTTLRKFPQRSTDFLQFTLWNAVSLQKLSRVTAKTAENAVPLRKESRETAQKQVALPWRGKATII
ncbi:MAG: hypothetical protein J6X39_06775, partial [Bacteroidales bacterium]|nr:hypothetical protein [Bacteroidales bacterium]